MSEKIERVVKEQAATWLSVKPPNPAGEEFAMSGTRKSGSDGDLRYFRSHMARGRK